MLKGPISSVSRSDCDFIIFHGGFEHDLTELTEPDLRSNRIVERRRGDVKTDLQLIDDDRYPCRFEHNERRRARKLAMIYYCFHPLFLVIVAEFVLAVDFVGGEGLDLVEVSFGDLSANLYIVWSFHRAMYI